MRFRVPAGLRPATRPRTFGVRCAPAKQQRYAGPIPAPAPGPLRLRRLRRRPAGPGPGLRPAAPRSGPRLRRPRLRLARAGPLRGPGLGYRAGSRPSPRLRQPPRGPPLRRGRVRVPAACARRALGHRAGGRAARPPRRCGPPCGGGGPLGCSVRPSRPFRPAPGPPCLAPVPSGRGWALRAPRGSSARGAAGRPCGPLGSAAAPRAGGRRGKEARLRPRSVGQRVPLQPLGGSRLRPLHPGQSPVYRTPRRPLQGGWLFIRPGLTASRICKEGACPIWTNPLYFDAAPLCCCRSWPYLASYSWYAMA